MPVGNQSQNGNQVQVFVASGIFFQVRPRQFEQRRCRTQAVLLQMHESAGQLNQSLVEIPIHAVTIRQPQILKNVVRLVKFLLVEQRKIPGIPRVHPIRRELPGQFCDAFMFVHAGSLRTKPAAESPKSRD